MSDIQRPVNGHCPFLNEEYSIKAEYKLLSKPQGAIHCTGVQCSTQNKCNMVSKCPLISKAKSQVYL